MTVGPLRRHGMRGGDAEFVQVHPAQGAARKSWIVSSVESTTMVVARPRSVTIVPGVAPTRETVLCVPRTVTVSSRAASASTPALPISRTALSVPCRKAMASGLSLICAPLLAPSSWTMTPDLRGVDGVLEALCADWYSEVGRSQ